MAQYYATEFVGGPDGTQNPPKRLDVRFAGAKERRIRATLPAGQVLNIGDQVYVGKLPANAAMRGVSLNADASFGATTLQLGPLANPGQYVNGKTMTVVDVPTGIGPRAAAAVAAPATSDTALWLTIGAAAVTPGNACIEIAYTTAN